MSKRKTPAKKRPKPRPHVTTADEVETALMKLGKFDGSYFPEVRISVPTSDLGEWRVDVFMMSGTGDTLEEAIWDCIGGCENDKGRK